MILCLYIDDILIFSTNHELVFETKRYHASQFDMKDMGEENVTLDVKITRKCDSLMLSQEHYIEKLLNKFGHFDVKSVGPPYDTSSQLEKINVSLLLNIICTNY